jgi:predicted  nucleic acid-binding Zn-ribbon protein
MSSSKLSPSLIAILDLLEDEATDDLTKWRNLCFTQLTRLRVTEFEHFQVGLVYEKTSTRLTAEFQNALERLSEITAIEENLKKSLEEVSRLEQEINSKFQHFNKANASENLLQIQIDQAPQTFSAIYDSHRATRLQDLQRLFVRVNKRINSLSTSIGRVEIKLQTLGGVIAKRREDHFRMETRADRLGNEISDLRTAFSEITLPTFPPEITAISSQFENSVEGSKKLLAIERSIAELEANMQKVHLDNRPSQCGALEDLIVKQKASNRNLQQTLLDRYKTDSLENEIEQAQRDVDEAQATLRRIRESTEAERLQMEEALQSQSIALRRKITENSEILDALREQIAELASQVPLPSRAAKISIATETVYKEPRFF